MRKLITQLAAALLFALGCVAPAFADGRGNAGPDIAAPPTHAAPVTREAAPQGRSGQIALMNDHLLLNVPTGWKFYPPEEAYNYLQRTNAAAPSGTVLGLLARTGVNPRQPGAWATVVSYDEIGYVPPQTASGLADPNFEQSVRDARRNQRRAFDGFATAPAFDANSATLAWAEHAAAPGAGGADLRIEKKLLGRKSVATLTTIGSADQAPDMQKASDELAPLLTFAEGYRQADFQAGVDQVSSYSVPGLVTGVPTPTAAPQALTDTQGEAQTSFGGFGVYLWIAVGIAILAALAYGIMRGRRKPEDAA